MARAPMLSKDAPAIRPVITLLTDFGATDPYVGMMKGVIVGICPAAAVVDLTHEVPPQDIRTGAFFLERSFSYFPRGTIHVAVVDPGVGTTRKALAIRSEGHVFIGPDNGLLTVAARRPHAIRLTRASYFRGQVSPTFHGRDIFAPVAAHLAAGAPFESFGPRLSRLVRLADVRPRRVTGGLRAAVASVDRFGNLVTNLDFAAWRSMRRPHLIAGAFRATKLQPSYGAVRRGELALVLGGYGLLEIAARETSAAKILGLGSGALVELLER